LNILGISAFYHDSAACLVRDGEIVAAAQEERFTRKKHDYRFPTRAIEYCLAEGGISAAQLDLVAFYDKPLLKFDRLIETYVAYAPQGFRLFLMGLPLWLKQKLYTPRELDEGLSNQYTGRYVFLEHHESHAASAFFPSPFDEAAILTLDGVGEWATGSIAVGRGNQIQMLKELRFPHSLGLLYSAFTYFTGFKVNSGEYKLMGPESPITQREMDLAASIQGVTEEIMLGIARTAHELTGMDNLCLAGGVALNCVGNGKILREGPFDRVWIQPAAGDAGGALGAALFVWHQLLENKREPRGRDAQKGSLLGPAYSAAEIQRFLDAKGAVYRKYENEDALCDAIAELVAQENVVGHCAGRMEFGPRALGARSILGDARSRKMQATMNVKIKFRESFRPFAPAVLREDVAEYFEMRPDEDSPYMLLVAPVRDDKRLAIESRGEKGLDKLRQVRSVVPAITHVDYSARVQTIDAERNPRFTKILQAFKRKTGSPVLINTSFNVRGEPIVNTPEDSYRCFMHTNMDALVLENFVLLKKDQPEAKEIDIDAYLAEFGLD